MQLTTSSVFLMYQCSFALNNQCGGGYISKNLQVITLTARNTTAENAAVLEANKSNLNKSDAKLTVNSSAHV